MNFRSRHQFAERLLAGTLFLGSLAGCATVSSALDPRGATDQFASESGFRKRFVTAGDFDLCTYARIQSPGGGPLHVYIEGDGLAWKGKNRLSGDPTPIYLMTLRLAALDPSLNIVYLARPGQYLTGDGQGRVDASYWSSRRFSEEVIASENAAIDYWAREAGTTQIHLIGYSGGGAVAVLVAARRTDIASLRTIAGNLDPELVNRTHRVSPLTGSLNPIDAASAIASIPQLHLIGVEDHVVPAGAAESFRAASGSSACIQIRPVDGVGHHNGWTERWLELLALPVHCRHSEG